MHDISRETIRLRYAKANYPHDRSIYRASWIDRIVNKVWLRAFVAEDNYTAVRRGAMLLAAELLYLEAAASLFLSRTGTNSLKLYGLASSSRISTMLCIGHCVTSAILIKLLVIAHRRDGRIFIEKQVQSPFIVLRATTILRGTKCANRVYLMIQNVIINPGINVYVGVRKWLRPKSRDGFPWIIKCQLTPRRDIRSLLQHLRTTSEWAPTNSELIYHR